MKPFTSIKEEHKYLFDLGTGVIRKHLIYAAIQLDVFTLLEHFESSESIANILGYDPANTKCLLNALVSVDMLEKEDSKYRNTEIANLYLSKNSDCYAGSLLIGMDNMVQLSQEDIIDAVKHGADSLVKKQEGLEAHAMFGDYTQLLLDSQRIGRATEVIKLLKQLPEYKHIHKMLDLGGGPGLISLALGMENDSLEGVVFETPKTVEVAKTTIKDYKIEDRFSTMAGDYMKDGIGHGYDLVLAIGTLNFAKHNMALITEKIYNSLNDGGIFVSISEGLTHEGTKPAEMVLGWLSSSLKGGDFHLDRGEVKNAALKAGFKNPERKAFRSVNGILDVDILRK